MALATDAKTKETPDTKDVPDEKMSVLLGHKSKKSGLFGVEIECEGQGLKIPNELVWDTVRDGSLRGEFPHSSAEWVFRYPLDKENSIKAIAALAELQSAKNGVTLNFSFRTSVHVHVNVQELTYKQYLNFIYTYILLENVLVNYCGEERVGNRFCLRLQDAEGIVPVLKRLFSNGINQLAYINNDSNKYSALNLVATLKYGSLEFRSMRGTLDVPVLTTWLSALGNLRDFAMSQDEPMSIYKKFQAQGAVEFAKEVLKECYLPLSYDDLKSDMDLAFCLSLDVVHSYVEQNYKVKVKEAKKSSIDDIMDNIDVPPAPPPDAFEQLNAEIVRGIRERQARELMRNAVGAPRFNAIFDDDLVQAAPPPPDIEEVQRTDLFDDVEDEAVEVPVRNLRATNLLMDL